MDITAIINSYADNPLFNDAKEDEVLVYNTPYRRPTRINDNQYINYNKTIGCDGLSSNGSLSTHRLLMNIYESDLLFLPNSKTSFDLEEMKRFYSQETISKADIMRPILENKAFNFLEEEVKISKGWTEELLYEYFNQFLEKENNKRGNNKITDGVLSFIASSNHPQKCLKHYVVQLAGDYLSEASAMARNSRVDREITLPGPPQIRACAIDAPGSSIISFAEG
ncbi:hypothetical protein SAMN05192555_103128 [Franzmannia pantelleriensis]|uniref:Uncharacterized protein n=1 Tax=Franzmannia pantelleriensis TaxID=48727 RepID=A0A1G9IBZ9_9GAMM|nr:hypothetical protein [Halomonas pantelleriensis]SDL22731.1 hypothetical protein SAMN05192555_103128 [Halomonas pantelleriensis]